MPRQASLSVERNSPNRSGLPSRSGFPPGVGARVVAMRRTQRLGRSADGSSGDGQRRGERPAGGAGGRTEDSTPLLFSVALAPEAYLQLDDVVVTVRPVPGVGPVLTSGIVTQVRARHEGATFGSDVFLINEGVLPAHVQEIAEVTTTRVDPECYVPPRPGVPVHRATGAERARALYFDRMERRVPVGMGRDGEPIYVNLEFLDGTRGGHVSIKRHLRGGHQDQFCALPALLDLPQRGARQPRREREGADLQRQG